MNAHERRVQQIDRLVSALDYSYEAEKYGVKLLRTVLGVISNDTLALMERYLEEHGDQGRARVTSLMADYPEEVIREVLTFGDAMGVDEVNAMVRIMDGIRERHEFAGANDLSRFDDDGRKVIRAFCMIQGAFYKLDPKTALQQSSYPVDPDIFRTVFHHPDRAVPIARLIGLGDMTGVSRITRQPRQIGRRIG